MSKTTKKTRTVSTRTADARRQLVEAAMAAMDRAYASPYAKDGIPEYCAGDIIEPDAHDLFAFDGCWDREALAAIVRAYCEGIPAKRIPAIRDRVIMAIQGIESTERDMEREAREVAA